MNVFPQLAKWQRCLSAPGTSWQLGHWHLRVLPNGLPLLLIWEDSGGGGGGESEGPAAVEESQLTTVGAVAVIGVIRTNSVPGIGIILPGTAM